MKKRDKALLSKREKPREAVLDWRENFLSSLSKGSYTFTNFSEIYLEEGNSKIGYSNEFYQKVFVWNIPPVVTCPGASLACKRYCYNADIREDKFPISKWNSNLLKFSQDQSGLAVFLLDKLNATMGSVAFRIHSSGDFFSNEYIDFWYEIISSASQVTFWAYTRSWAVKELLPKLERLRTLDNLQLFASVDSSMTTPPTDWRRSFVYSVDQLDSANELICPEQSGQKADCISCKYCLQKKRGDVYFILH